MSPGSHMTEADDRACWELSQRGWSHRRIAAQMDRSHRSIPAAIARHQRRLDDGELDGGRLLLDDAKIVKWERYQAWVEEGRIHGWDHLLVSGLTGEDQ